MIVACLPDLGDVELWYSGSLGCGWVARCRAGVCGQVCGQVHDGAAGVAGGPAGEGEQPVAQPFRLPPAGLLAEERKRLGLTQRQVAELMGVSPGRVSQIENGDLDVNEVATLSRYARALGARMRIIFDYGNDLRQIA